MNIAPRDEALWIDGRPTPAASGRHIERADPATGALVARFAAGEAADVERAIAVARARFDDGRWPATTGADRAALLSRTARLLREQAEPLALMETRESGKPIAQARHEIGWAAGLWDYAAALARQLHGQSYNQLGASALGLTLREPIGVVGLITPWNFPLLIISQKLPFALAAGCAAVVKPSEFTSGTTLRLAAILKDAGLPDGVVNVVTGTGDAVGAALASHDGVDMVSFTGSTRVGKSIVAASRGNLKKVALELGGKNPQVVRPDADLDAAADAIAFGVLFNMGECCNSGSRLIVHESVADALVERVVAACARVRVGDPMDPATQVGAMIHRQHFDKVLAAVAEACADGAAIRCGGSDDARGLFIRPTVLDRVRPDMPIARDEIFGPVLCVLRARDDAQALALANDTTYGLSASVWTRDLDASLHLARSLRAGTVWINTFMDGAAELPFGGYRQSGLGRELGLGAVEEYTQTKTLFIHTGPRTSWWAV